MSFSESLYDYFLCLLAEELHVQCSLPKKHIVFFFFSIIIFCSLQGINNLPNQWFHMQQTGPRKLCLYFSHMCLPGLGEMSNHRPEEKKEKRDRSSCPPANRKRQCSLCPRLLWSQPSGRVISEESWAPGELLACLFKAQDVLFQARLSEENASGVVGNCQGVAIRPLKCFEWFLVLLCGCLGFGR